MSEKIMFHFTGAMADEHAMNFYEAARFQYAAARLVVKLSQFRQDGRFVKKITNVSNKEIILTAPKEGSFDLSIIVPAMMAAKEVFLNLPISDLMSYVFERIVGKASNSEIIDALNSVEEISKQFGKISDNNTNVLKQALDIIQKDQSIKEKMYEDQRDNVQRLEAEITREREIQAKNHEFSKIDAVREQKLISMSAPLVSEMTTALRKSAKKLEIVSNPDTSNSKKILFLNRKMAQDIELSKVDDEITVMLGNIVQYNKETGWGKIRLSISEDLLSFSVPSDINSKIREKISVSMIEEEVYAQMYIVRDRTNEPSRVIIVGILQTPKQ